MGFDRSDIFEGESTNGIEMVGLREGEGNIPVVYLMNEAMAR